MKTFFKTLLRILGVVGIILGIVVVFLGLLFG